MQSNVYLDDLALDVIAEAIRRAPAQTYIAHCEAARQTTKPQASQGAGKAQDSAESSKPAKSRALSRKSSRSAK
jgi:hypothetical protein